MSPIGCRRSAACCCSSRRRSASPRSGWRAAASSTTGCTCASDAWASSRRSAAMLVFATLLWPTFWMGVSLPVLSRAIAPQIGDAARRVGMLYGLNTLGAAAGAFATTWLLFPRIGFDNSLDLGGRPERVRGAGRAAARLHPGGSSSPPRHRARPVTRPTGAVAATPRVAVRGVDCPLRAGRVPGAVARDHLVPAARRDDERRRPSPSARC